MKHKDAILLTAIYYPKRGFEESFIKLWNKKICKLAYQMGATSVGMFHNEETEEFLISAHFPSKELVLAFLNSPAFKKANEETNHLCLIPATREMFEILREAA